MPADTLPIESRRAARVKRVQTMQHVLAAFILITNAMDHLSGPHAHVTVLPVLELLAGGALIAMAIREKVRHVRGAHHDRVAWLEIAGAIMTGIEAYSKTRGHHHLLFYVLAFVQPVILLAFAVFDSELQQRRYLRADDDGVEIRTRAILRRRMPWSQMKAFAMRDGRIRVTRPNGSSKTLSLRDVKDRAAAEAWMRDQFARHGVEELAAK